MGSALLQGFGTTLTVTYSTTEPKFNTLAGAMRVLVAPADLRLTVSRLLFLNHQQLHVGSSKDHLGCSVQLGWKASREERTNRRSTLLSAQSGPRSPPTVYGTLYLQCKVMNSAYCPLPWANYQ
jgi:hypothetical protein